MRSLRELPVDQQVALLFLILGGALVLLTSAAVVIALRGASSPERALHHDHFRRELSALWVGASVFWLAWVSGAVGATLLFGVVSFLALREFVTLMHTRRSDHRSLLLAFFAVLPLQYAIVGGRWFDLFTVFIPVYVFLALPMASALAGDPERFLERNAKIQWGIMVCVYGLSHAPALLLLEFPRYEGRGAFLLFFLVVVAFTAAWIGAALYWITPFKAGQALAIGFIAAGAGTLGELVMKALKRDAGVLYWGNRSSVTGAVGLLDRVAPLCFAAPVFFHSVRWYFRV